MRIFLAGVIIALLTLSATAQGMFGGGGGGGRRHHGQQSEQGQPKRPKQDDRVQTPVQDNKPVGTFDPWQNMRGSGSDPGKTNKNPS